MKTTYIFNLIIKYIIINLCFIFTITNCAQKNLMDTFNNPYKEEIELEDGDLSSCNEITTFEFLKSENTGLASDVQGHIDHNNLTIDLTIPQQGFDISALVPYITITGVSMSPEVNGLSKDFSEGPVIFTVTAEDDTQKDYSVIVDNGLPAAPYAPENTVFSPPMSIKLTSGNESDFKEFIIRIDDRPPESCSDGMIGDENTLIDLPPKTTTLYAIACDNFGNASELTTRVYTYDPNLVRNGSFEIADPLYWNIPNTQKYHVSTVEQAEGDKSMSLTHDDNGSIDPLSQDIILSPDTEYILSMSMMLSVDTIYGSVVFDTNDVFDSSESCQFILEASQKGTWQNYSCTFNTGTHSGVKLRFFHKREQGLKGTAYLDNVILRKK